MDRIVEVLLEEETLSGDRFREILSQFQEIPAAGSKNELVGVTEM